MDVANGLSRAYTTPYPGPLSHGHHKMHSSGPPSGPPSLVQSQIHTSSTYSIQSQPSSRSSDTTQGTAHSTLFPPPPLPVMGPASGGTGVTGMVNGYGSGSGPVEATGNVMNKVANKETSLFQICVSLRQRLMGVPGFDESLLEEEEDADDDTDPVTLLWRTFRRGFPLMLLYNTLRPTQPLQIDASRMTETKRGKAATFKFLQACVNDLKFPAEECFIITDLYGDDTTGFVKVARVVNRVLDILISKGLVADVRPDAGDYENSTVLVKRTQRQHIVDELVKTERTYVQHLELLQTFKKLVEEKGVIPGDAVHDIFLNLNSLLDFQRRFLIRVEQTNAQPETEQNWGKLFVLYNDAFKVYEPYIANQKRCEQVVVREFDKLREAGGSLEMRQMVESPPTLYGFLMKPFQRLSKYPILLDQLYKKGDLDEERKADLVIGNEAATSVLTRTNAAMDREEKAEAVQELKNRVEDWKGHRVEGFGELMLYGTFTVLKSESAPSKDGEREYHVYLFETILLCCKDINLNKPKNKLGNKQLVDKRGKPKLQLKGRIFMQNVTDLVSLAKPGKNSHLPNSHPDFLIRIKSNAQIFWKGDPGIENFIIRFMTEEGMKKWAQQIEAQRRRYHNKPRLSDQSRPSGTSVTEFTYMQNHAALENPYKEEEEEEDEPDPMSSSGHLPGHVGRVYSNYMGKSDISRSRNGSSTSLRSRSTTGDSSAHPASAAPATGRALPPRFAQGSLPKQPALSLRTQQLQAAAASPGERGAESYFSPTTESPMSSRTSGSSGMYPFPRQQVPQNGYYEDGHGHTRFTAPAIGRAPLPRDQTAPPISNGYSPSGRGITPRPSFPAGSSLHSAQQMPMAPRNRSASSPDIHNAQRGMQNARHQPPIPDMPVPYLPQHLSSQSGPMFSSQVGPPRSQTNSPSLSMTNGGPPSRAANQSPQLSRERSYQQGQDPRYGYEGAQAPPQQGARPDPRMMVHPSSSNLTPVPAQQSGTPALAHRIQETRAQAFSPPPASLTPVAPTAAPAADNPQPTQLKVKVHAPAANQILTLVVPLYISYQSLKDRIDAKLQRSTNLTLGERGGAGNQVKLKYLDEDDYVSIQSDEDVQTAFETWREQRGDGAGTGMGEIELFCQK